MKFTRLSHQFLAVFVAIFVLVLGISGWRLTTLAQRTVADNAQRGHQELARCIAEEIDLEVESISLLLSLLAESATVQSMDPVAVEAELTRYQTRFPVIGEAYVADLTGQQIARTGGRPLQSVATFHGFQVAREGHQLISDVYLPQDEQVPVLTLFLPIENEGRVVGVLTADISFGRVQTILEDLTLTLTRDEMVVILASNGQVVAHSRLAEMAEPQEFADSLLAQELARGPAGVLTGYSDELGRTVVSVHAPASELDWGVVIQTPVGELTSEIAALRRMMIGGMLIGVALAVVIGWLMPRSLGQSIGQLAQAAGQIAAGDLGARSGLSNGRGELDQLAHAFDEMAKALQMQRADAAQAEEAQRRERDLAGALEEAAAALTATLDSEQVLDRILEQVQRVIPGDASNIMLIKGDEVRVARWHGYERFGAEEFISTAVFRIPEVASFQQMLASGDPIVISDTATHPGWLHMPAMAWLRSYVAVPIAAHDEEIGFLSVDSATPSFFSQAHLEPLRAFANHAAVAIENARLYEQVQRHAIELEARIAAATEEIRQRADERTALYEVSRSLVATLDLDTLLPVIVRRVTHTLKADRCAIFLFDEQAGVLRAQAAQGYMAERLANFSYRPGEEVVGWAFATGEPQYVPDLEQAPDLPRRDEIRAILAVPLVSPTTGALGVLSITSLQMGAFGSDQQQLLETMAGQIAAAIESARLFNQSQDRAKELAVLNELSRTLTTYLSVEQVLIEAYRGAARLLDATNFYVTLYDADRDQITSALRIIGGQSQEPKSIPRGGLTDYLIKTRQPLLIPDGVVERIKELGLNASPLVPGRVSASWLGVPITLGDRVLGTMAVLDYTTPGAYNERHSDLLWAMANQVAIAINNAQLYRRSEQHAIELAVLYEIEKKITATLELDIMLQSIADEAVRLVQADKGLILLVDAERKELVKAVGHGYSREQLNSHSFQEFQQGISGWVLQEKTPTLSADIQADERNRGKALVDTLQSGDRSAALAPLLIGDEMIGTLTVVNGREKRAFTSADLDLVTMLAGQAAIAIQNARLYEAAQEADRIKSAFLAAMSHELRTPLNSIIGFTGILLQGLVGPLTEEQTKQLGMVMNSARHLLELINDVLDISKIEAGQFEIASEPFDMRQAIERAVQTVRPLADKKGLLLSVNVAPEVGQIDGDQRRVEQVLINLINNAIKFTEEGEVHVESQVGDDWLVTRVVDTGIGIMTKDLGTLFKPFRQIDIGVTRQHEGTGLGLSICKRLVEMLGGEIWVESQWGVGSAFTFTLPT